MPNTFIDAVCGRALCSTCDLDLSAQRSVLDIDGILT